MLRLAHPAGGGQGPDPPTRRKGSRPAALSFSPEEAHNVRTAIRGAARTFGGLAALARKIGVRSNALHGRRMPGPGLALAVARVAGLSLDAMIAGKLTDAGKCPSCGAKRAEEEPPPANDNGGVA
jgi:hypothetical protein